MTLRSPLPITEPALQVARVIAKLEPGGAQLSAFRLSASLRRHGLESRLLAGDATRAGIRLARAHGLEPECFRRRRYAATFTPQRLGWEYASTYRRLLAARRERLGAALPAAA